MERAGILSVVPDNVPGSAQRLRSRQRRRSDTDAACPLRVSGTHGAVAGAFRFCASTNTMRPNAGTQFCEERPPAQLVPQMSVSGSGDRSRLRPLCTPMNAQLSDAGTRLCEECSSAQPVEDLRTLSAVRTGRSFVWVSWPLRRTTHP